MAAEIVMVVQNSNTLFFVIVYLDRYEGGHEALSFICAINNSTIDFNCANEEEDACQDDASRSGGAVPDLQTGDT